MAARVFTSLRARMPVLYTEKRGIFAAGAVCGAIAGMPMLTGEEFFEHKFVTKKDPDDIADFYSTEDFLQILGLFPFAIHFVLSGVEWDLERENTMVRCVGVESRRLSVGPQSDPRLT